MGLQTGPSCRRKKGKACLVFLFEGLIEISEGMSISSCKMMIFLLLQFDQPMEE